MSKAKLIEEIDIGLVDQRLREMRAESLGMPILASKPGFLCNAILPKSNRYEDSCAACGISVEYISYEPLEEVVCRSCRTIEKGDER